MKITYSEVLTSRYPIRTKIFLPGDGELNGIALGVHGFAGDKESSALSALGEALTRRGIGLVCFDFPCHGDSPVQEDQLTIRNCMEDVLTVAGFCASICPTRKRYLFATSFGGFITLLCAPQLSDYRIVLRAPAVTMPEHILTDLLRMTPEEFREKGSVQCGFERSLELPYAFYEELQHYDVMSERYDVPMLVIHGDADDVVPHGDILRFCAAHPTMQLNVIPGADHRFKKPGEIEQVVRAALVFWGLEE